MDPASLADAFTDPPAHRHPARILQAYQRLGYQFFDCYTREGVRFGIAARSFHHAKAHADRISRSGRVTVVRIREVRPPAPKVATAYVEKYLPKQTPPTRYLDDGCGETSAGV